MKGKYNSNIKTKKLKKGWKWKHEKFVINGTGLKTELKNYTSETTQM